MPVIWMGTVLGGTICLLFRYLLYWEAQYACYLDIHGIRRHNKPVIWMARYWEAQYACYLDIYGIGRRNMPVI